MVWGCCLTTDDCAGVLRLAGSASDCSGLPAWCCMVLHGATPCQQASGCCSCFGACAAARRHSAAPTPCCLPALLYAGFLALLEEALQTERLVAAQQLLDVEEGEEGGEGEGAEGKCCAAASVAAVLLLCCSKAAIVGWQLLRMHAGSPAPSMALPFCTFNNGAFTSTLPLLPCSCCWANRSC